MTQYVPVITCHDCGLLQKISHMPEEGTVKCCRCDATLRKRERVKPEKSIEHTLALVITGLVLLAISNAFPIIQVDAEGHEMAATLFGCVKYLFTHDMVFIAGLVFLTTIGAPLIQLTGLLYILLPLNFKRIPPYAPQTYRLVRIITSWSMLEVLMLGILVSIVKLSAMATVAPSIALWSFALLMIVIAAILNDVNKEMLWGLISPDTKGWDTQQYKSGVQLTNCHNCHLIQPVSPEHDSDCPRCKADVHWRKPDSLTRCTALVIAATVLYIPANLLPVMVVTSLGKTEGDTIISGVMYLATTGDLPLAIILFIASICVPTIKLIILYLLLFTVHFKSQWRPKERTQLYRLTEFIGRWSMVDIYVDSLMAAMIQIEGLIVIEVGVGAVAFGAVVVLTILAAKAFDPRLIWDSMEKEK